jgi:hypothetical protein
MQMRCVEDRGVTTTTQRQRLQYGPPRICGDVQDKPRIRGLGGVVGFAMICLVYLPQITSPGATKPAVTQIRQGAAEKQPLVCRIQIFEPPRRVSREPCLYLPTNQPTVCYSAVHEEIAARPPPNLTAGKRGARYREATLEPFTQTPVSAR